MGVEQGWMRSVSTVVAVLVLGFLGVIATIPDAGVDSR